MSNVISTVTSGIQDISAVLPLLGTEQCEKHTGSALEKGYLYSAITPISIFGSLGIVKTGFNILVAGIVVPSWKFLGAERLADGGFRPGDVAQLIAFDPENPRRFLAESNVEALLQREHIENVEDLEVDWAEGSLNWNIQMADVAFFVCSILGMTPYIYLILRTEIPRRDPLFLAGWGFPVARLVSSSIATIVIQFIVQIRILVIIKNRLVFITMDRYMKKQTDGLDQRHMEMLKRHVPDLTHWSADRSSEKCLWELETFLGSVASTNVNHAFLSPNATNSARSDRNHPSHTSIEVLEDTSAAYDFSPLQSYFLQTKKRHFPPSRFRGFGLKDIIHTWPYFFLHIFLLFVSIVTVVGYAGTFNLVQNSRRSAGPIVWLALEAVLCFLRIGLWAWNPDWDDNKGVAFKIALASKNPLVTCNKYGDDLESTVDATAVRSKTFLAELASYTGPIPAVKRNDAALYYILTGSKYSEVEPATKALYIVISDFQEQTSRVVVKRTPEAGFSFLMSTIKPDARSTVITVKIHPTICSHQDSNDSKTSPETHVLTADPDFMRELSNHYDIILDRINDIDHGGDRTFYAGWAIQDVELCDPTSDPAHSRPRSQPKLTSADVEYLNQGWLETHRDVYNERLEKWINDYLRLYTRDLLEQVPYSSHSPMSKLEGIEINEVEYLIIEARRQMEKLLLKTLKEWQAVVDRARGDMITKVVGFFTMDDSNLQPPYTTQELVATTATTSKLRSRLLDEQKWSFSHMTLLDWEKMRSRVHSDFEAARTRIHGRKYLDPKEGNRIIYKWKKLLGLDDAWAEYSEIPNPKSNESFESHATILSIINDRTEDYKVSMDKRLRSKARFLRDSGGDNLRRRCQGRVARWQDALQIHVDEFSMLSDTGFLHKVSFSYQEFDTRRKYWSNPAMNLRLQVLDKNLKYLMVSDDLVEGLGGFENLALALRQSCVSLLYFECKFRVSDDPDEHSPVHQLNSRADTRDLIYLNDASDVDDSSNDESLAEGPPELPELLLHSTMQAVTRSSPFITGIHFSDKGYHVSNGIQELIQQNIDAILRTPGIQIVCEFRDIEITDYLRRNRPYVLLGHTRTSKCTVKCCVDEKVNHVLTLVHAFKTLEGEIDIKLNGQRLAKSKGSRQRTTNEFHNENFSVPGPRLRMRPEVNIITITLLGQPLEEYYLSDVVLNTTASQQSSTGMAYFTGHLSEEPEQIIPSSSNNLPMIKFSRL